MGIERVFRDINGIEWRVSYVTPAMSTAMESDLVDGWLSFEASHHLERRLTPVPKGWEKVTIQRLEQMCRIATPIQREPTAIASHRMRVQAEPIAEPTVDTAPAESTDAVAEDSHALDDHMSLLANAWPARESRIMFRG